MTDDDERKVAKYAKHMRAIRKAKGLNKRDKDDEKKPSIKLALEEVPTFDGSFQEWQVFKAMFTRMVDKNDNLSEDDKVRYLIRACAGEAKKIIYPVANDSDAYKRMMDALKDHYENSNKVKENIYAEIRKLPFITNRNDPNVFEFKNEALLIIKHVQKFFNGVTDFHQRVVRE